MSDISVDLAPGKTVKVRLSDLEFNEFSEAAVFAKRHGAIVYGDIGEYMVFATRNSLMTKKRLPPSLQEDAGGKIKGRASSYYIIREFEDMTIELDSWGEVNGGP